MRVLIADANEVFLEALQSFLWDHGHEAEIAGDGLECLVTLREFAPDVLVLDRDLIWGDGVVEHMREDPSLARVPVIFVANEASSNHSVRLDSRWLRKPIRFSDLLARIDALACFAICHGPTFRRDAESRRRVSAYSNSAR